MKKWLLLGMVLLALVFNVQVAGAVNHVLRHPDDNFTVDTAGNIVSKSNLKLSGTSSTLTLLSGASSALSGGSSSLTPGPWTAGALTAASSPLLLAITTGTPVCDVNRLRLDSGNRSHGGIGYDV